MKPSRILSNLVGFMLFVQVILGGGAVLLGWWVNYHVFWGVVTFAVLIVAAVYAVRELGSKSALFRVGVAAIVDYVIQIGLGLSALANNSGTVILVHLTNAFVLSVLVTYLISFADSADKNSALHQAIARAAQ
jgi:heme A synthase